jgi:hypothetical protein
MRKIIEWNYQRGSWQWDVLCIVILCFIFLTPKAWFDKREKLATQTARLIVKADDYSSDRAVLENRVKEMSGNPQAEILETRERKDAQGVTFYEIDIK